MEVTIKVDPYQANYFRTLPVHHSQKELEPVDGYPVFSYYISPTLDFIQEILSHGKDVEVLAPESLRDEIAGIASGMVKIYSRK